MLMALWLLDAFNMTIRHTGIPIMDYGGWTYPPCSPSISILADNNPFCDGELVTFTGTPDCTESLIKQNIKYGALYNWYAATDVRKITSSDSWVVPTRVNWNTLLASIGATGGALKLKDTGSVYWLLGNGTNIYSFSARGTGYRASDSGTFEQINDECRFISSSAYASWGCYCLQLLDNNDNLVVSGTDRKIGFSIRLVRTATAAEQLLADGTACAPYVGNDGKIYPTVKIGTQVWTAENLVETKYRNDDWITGFDGGVYTPISDVDWAAKTTEAMCYYDDLDTNAFGLTELTYQWYRSGYPVVGATSLTFSASNFNNNETVILQMKDADNNVYWSNNVVLQERFDCISPIKYGLLYNWYAATDERNICADGWDVPTQAQYSTLNTYLGGSDVSGGHLKQTGTAYWTTPNAGADNSSGFGARGGGYRKPSEGFSVIRLNGFYWTSSIFDDTYSIYISMAYDNDNLVYTGALNKPFGNSLRLIKIATTLTHGQTGTYTGNDGKIYRTICIGTQEWLADNLAETKYRDGTPIPEVTDNAEWAALTTPALCAYNNDWSNV